jgi:hypothetical protein
MPPTAHSSADGLYRILFFLFAGTLLFDEKIRQSAVQPVFRALLRDTNPPSRPKMYSSRILGVRFVEKNGGLLTHNPSAKEIRELEAFLY